MALENTSTPYISFQTLNKTDMANAQRYEVGETLK